MNSCNFVGMIVDNDPILEEEDGAKVVRFYVSVKEYRKDANGVRKKIYNTLGFEAWDSGAEAICANCKQGSFIALETNARCDEETGEVYFRVKNFEVLGK